MNVAVICGRLTNNAVVFGREQQTLKFTVACQSGFNPANQETRVEFVPCVCFRAPPKLRDLLVSQGKGKPVQLRGRIITSTFEKNSQTHYATEVVIEPKDLHLVRIGSSEITQPTKGEQAYESHTARDLYGSGGLGH